MLVSSVCIYEQVEKVGNGSEESRKRNIDEYVCICTEHWVFRRFKIAAANSSIFVFHHHHALSTSLRKYSY